MARFFLDTRDLKKQFYYFKEKLTKKYGKLPYGYKTYFADNIKELNERGYDYIKIVLKNYKQKNNVIKEIKKQVKDKKNYYKNLENNNEIHTKSIEFDTNNIYGNAKIHKKQIDEVVKNNPNKLYIHTVEFFDENCKLETNGNYNISGANKYYNLIDTSIDFSKRTYKFKKWNINKWHKIYFDMTAGSALIWLAKLWIAENENNKIKITTKAYDKFTYNNRDNKQIYKENINNSCFYDGVLSYFKNKYEKNKDRNASANINKLIKYEKTYKKPYTENEILDFCQDFKISITIKDFIANDDIKINHNKFNRNNIKFINTKYNHLDLLLNENNDAEEIEKDKYDKIKEETNFYVESFGKLITIDNTYSKKKDDFKIIYSKWFDKYNMSRKYINTNSDEYKMILQYDYNMHRFFQNYSGNENDYYEIDLKKAYYNYSDKNYNSFYVGVPSGSFINHKCDNNFTIDLLKKQVENGMVGFYQVRISKIITNKNLDKLGFSLNSVHVLFTSMIILLSDYIEFTFLNASFAPSIHIPFGEEFKENINDGFKKIKYYSKACGLLLAEQDEIKINIKPLEKDKHFYKTFYNENYEVFEINGIYSIIMNNTDIKTYTHIAKSIHAYTTTIILRELLNMDFNKVLGVKLDSIVLLKEYNYKFDDNLFGLKEPKLKDLFENAFGFVNDLDDYDDEQKKMHYELNYNNNGLFNNYKLQSNEILEFKKIFTPNCEYIINKCIYFGGMGGTGKTYSILNSSIPKKNICYTTSSWDLIQNKQKEYDDIIGLSMPKLTGFCNGKKIEKIKNNNIKFVAFDEMTLNDVDQVENVLKDYSDCFIFLLGDVSEDGFAYQCSINNKYYKPNINNQYIQFTKTYRFDEELNKRLLMLRDFMIKNKDIQNINNLVEFFKSIFGDRYINSNKIIFGDNDVGISTFDDFRRDNKLTEYFINKGTKPQYYIKNTNLQNGQLRGQKLHEKPDHNNYECKLFKTIHSYQGRELDLNNKIIIFLGGLFDYNLLYTAVSRARRSDQIYIFDKF